MYIYICKHTGANQAYRPFSYLPPTVKPSPLSLPPSYPLAGTVKHNINNVVSSIPINIPADVEPRKRSMTRIQATEKAQVQYNEAFSIIENLKTALEGKMEVAIIGMYY